ncbi:tryptophan synthase subunit alpha [Canibacter oris]|uniref:Tryptophan synthase alpha chain n=1 Tax=Canibacter oris TaxID=1365628 RepID=A0A840DM95_9MICO|nr:tryptophan synthase subunit alpha [Canibacter oris]MBB4071127.1 tryptophan synthase alpha chain [Canibacter oris]
MSTRYDTMFQRLTAENCGAFVPFLMLGDPTAELSLEIVRTVVAAGADALELGVAFSDPVADGPTIAKSHVRALTQGITVKRSLQLVRQIREEFPDIPIGMLVYGNVAFARGIAEFYRDFKAAGADSILIPDVPVRESASFVTAAAAADIAPIFIAPPQASEQTLAGVAAHSRGYIYGVSRDGVTGTEREARTTGLAATVQNIKRFGGAPLLLGFGISTPQHVSDALAAGAAGAITGSAITAIIEQHAEEATLLPKIANFVAQMKAATKLTAAPE